VDEVVEKANLKTWAVTGPDVLKLQEPLNENPAVEQVAPFGNALHVSGDDPDALEKAIAPFRSEHYRWRQVDSGLEDVFIHLMEKAKRKS
jgi:ABC-2 type transport system ATP-binding protein